MSKWLTRRRLLTTGLATAAGGSGLAAAIRMAGRYGLIPPDCGGLWGVGETITYASHRILTAGNPLAREFDRSAISTMTPVKHNPPKGEKYRQLFAGEFVDWRLTVEGMVARPGSFSLADLKSYPSQTQITHMACEEGWSFIAEWTGVPLRHVLDLVGVLPQAKYAVFIGLDRVWDSHDMHDAWHPQTLLAYEMNGEKLTMGHGAPLRLRVTRQLGYKNVKWLSRIVLTDNLKLFGKRTGKGGASAEAGWSWYAGI